MCSKMVLDPLEVALQDFRASLSPSQRAELASLQTCPDTTAVVTFTAEIDRANAKRKSRCVASRLMTVLQSIQQFAAVVDTFIQANPSIAALVWGSIKITILAVSNFASYFDRLSEVFMRLRSDCPRFSEYQLLYAESPSLQLALCKFYATIVRFCKRAMGALQRNGLEHAAKSLFKPFDSEFGSLEADLQMQGEEVKAEIQLAAAQAAHQERRTQQAFRNRANLFHQLTITDSGNTREYRRQTEERRLIKRRFCQLRALSDYDYLTTFKQARKKRHVGTSMWLHKSTEYQLWLKDDQSPVFWCSGKLGCGKSILTTSIVDDMCCSRTKHEAVCFFFCRYDDKQSLIPRIILGSLVRQVLEAGGRSARSEQILDNLFGDASSSKASLGPEDLETLFVEALTSFQKSFIVIDGIDECTKGDRDILLSTLQRVLTTSYGNVKLFIASRPSVKKELLRKFKTLYHRTMDQKTQEVQQDIQTYIEDTISQKFEDGELTVGDSKLILEIHQALVAGAQGMFLWVYFQIQDICEQETDENIRKIITNLPKDLNETYERILTKICDGNQSDIAVKVFQWVAIVKRPLTLRELQEALAVEPRQETWNPERMLNDITQIVPWCGNLIALEEEEETVQFAHHSIKQFFEFSLAKPELARFRLEQPGTNRYVGVVCVTYLTFTDFDFERRVEKYSPIPTRRMIEPQKMASTLSASTSKFARLVYLLQEVPKYRDSRFDYVEKASDLVRKTADDSTTIERLRADYHFLGYACEYWLAHTGDISKDDKETWNRWKPLLKAKNPLAQTPWSSSEWAENSAVVMRWLINNDHCALLQLWLEEKNHLLELEFLEVLGAGPPSKLLYWIAKNTRETDPHRLEYALASAAKTNNLTNVEILWPPLFALRGSVGRGDVLKGLETAAVRVAAKYGHLEIVRYLLDHGANVECEDKEKNGPLHCAAFNGYEAIVKLLLERGANPLSWNADNRKPSEMVRGTEYKSITFMLEQAEISKRVVDAARKTASSAPYDWPEDTDT